ncbi:hypothetical protein HK405_008543, partial [Cladochytrium tenue]
MGRRCVFLGAKSKVDTRLASKNWAELSSSTANDPTAGGAGGASVIGAGVGGGGMGIVSAGSLAIGSPAAVTPQSLASEDPLTTASTARHVTAPPAWAPPPPTPTPSMEDLIQHLASSSLGVAPDVPQASSSSSSLAAANSSPRALALPRRPGAPRGEERQLVDEFFRQRYFLVPVVHRSSALSRWAQLDPLLRLAVLAAGAEADRRRRGTEPFAADARADWYLAAATRMLAEAAVDATPSLERLQALCVLAVSGCQSVESGSALWRQIGLACAM